MSAFVPGLRLRRAFVALVAGLLLSLAAAAPAKAHSFLIRSDPAAGARLAEGPAALTLYFSEPFVPASEEVTLRRVGGETIELPQPTSRAASVRQPLPTSLRGVYIVHWQVLSDDGHISLGEFAFAVGSNAALPVLKGSTTRTSWSEVAASWLVFVGLALALGGLASERFIWLRTPLTARNITGAAVWPGVALATVGASLQLGLLGGDRRGGGFGAGLSASAVSDALATRPGKLTVALLVSLAVAGIFLPLRWWRVAATVPLFAAVVFVAARGHSGTSGHGWALVADIIHLSAVAVWLGALAHLVLVVLRSGARRATLIEGARRYSRFALPTVILIGATGVLTAIPEFRSVSAVVTSGYGRTLLIKAALVAVALLLALAARRRALPANPRPRLPLLKRLTVAEATVLAAALVVVAVLVNAAPPRGPAAAAAGPAAQLGPPPVAGPSAQLADLAGQLGLAVTAGGKELQFTVIPPGEQPAGSLKLTAEARRPSGRAVDLYPRPCGSTCFTIRFRLTPGTTVVRAHLSSSEWRGGMVAFWIPWPLPPERPRLLRRVVAAMNAVPALTLNEAVTSGPGSGGRATAYRLSGRRFMTTELFRSGAVDVRVVGRERGLTQLAFALPGSSIWYRIWFDARYRLRREMIISPGHLIRRRFRYGAQAAGVRATSSTPPAVVPTGGTPPPAPGAVTLGREDGDLAVGLAVRPERAALELQTTVLAPNGRGLSGLEVSYRITGRGDETTAADPCGSGCYRARVRTAGRPRSVSVRLVGAGRPASTVEFALPRRPPPVADGLLRRTTRTFRGLKTLVIHERLASSPTNVVVTTYQIVAPDRLAYQIEGGPQVIIVDDRRWDRRPGAPWEQSPQLPVHQPAPAWSAATNAHLLGTGRLRGRSVWIVSFYDPRSTAFFTIRVDKETHRMLELRMTAAAHFMRQRYSRFNAPLAIVPPR
jgi:copper transport protein